MRKANTGIDADGTYKNFIKGDIIANIDVVRPQKAIHQTISNRSQGDLSSTPLMKTPLGISMTPDKYAMTKTKGWTTGCTKYQALRNSEWQDEGLVNQMRPSTSITRAQPRLKTDFISSINDRPMNLDGPYDPLKHGFIEKVIKERQ